MGKSGFGKTLQASRLWTFKPTVTLFFDLKAGDEGWAGDTSRSRT
jgi:hypothetical protein